MVNPTLSTFGKRIGVSSDHGGFELKEKLIAALIDAGYNVVDYGAKKLDKDDDYPDLIIPLAKAISKRRGNKGSGYLRKWCWCMYYC